MSDPLRQMFEEERFSIPRVALHYDPDAPAKTQVLRGWGG